MNASPTIRAIQTAALHEQLFLVALLSEFRRSGVEEALLGNVANTHIALTRLRGLPKPSVSTLSAVCARLGSAKLLLTQAAEQDVYAKIRLNCTPEDVMFALQDDPTVQTFAAVQL